MSHFLHEKYTHSSRFYNHETHLKCFRHKMLHWFQWTICNWKRASYGRLIISSQMLLVEISLKEPQCYAATVRGQTSRKRLLYFVCFFKFAVWIWKEAQTRKKKKRNWQEVWELKYKKKIMLIILAQEKTRECECTVSKCAAATWWSLEESGKAFCWVNPTLWSFKSQHTVNRHVW